MSYQINDYGKTVAELAKNGQSTGREGIPVGAFHDDGEKRYRWAFCRFAATGAKVGRVVIGTSHYASTAALSGGHFTSAVERYGAAGSREIHVYNASLLSVPGRYQNGTFEALSGKGGPFVVDIESVEQGKSGGTTLITLAGELPRSLSTNTGALVRPNKYYGCQFAAIVQSAQAIVPSVGATTASAVTSGWQLLQTRGIGIGFLSSNIAAGKLMGAGAASGQLVCATMDGTSAYALALCRTRNSGASALKFSTVDWFFE